MKKSIPVNKKSRGRPKKAGGVDPVSAVRLPSELTEQVDAWGEKRELNRSAAIRRLVELGLRCEEMTGPYSAGLPWTRGEEDQLRALLEAGMKTPAIAPKLRRIVSAVRTRRDVLNKREARLKAKGK
jgi:hypothetical protein